MIDELLELINEILKKNRLLDLELHELHWHYEGSDWLSVHALTQEQYEHIHAEYDDLTELAIQGGMTPFVEGLVIDTANKSLYQTPERVLNILSILYSLYRVIAQNKEDLASPELQDHAVSQCRWIKEQIWKLEQADS